MPEKPINFAARFEYLSAIEAHWPEVLKSLRDHTFPVYRACLGTESQEPRSANPGPLVEGFTECPSGRFQAG